MVSDIPSFALTLDQIHRAANTLRMTDAPSRLAAFSQAGQPRDELADVDKCRRLHLSHLDGGLGSHRPHIKSHMASGLIISAPRAG